MPRPAPRHLALTLATLFLAGSPAQGEVKITGAYDDQDWSVSDPDCTECVIIDDRDLFQASHTNDYFGPLGLPSMQSHQSLSMGIAAPLQGVECNNFGQSTPWSFFGQRDTTKMLQPAQSCLIGLHMGIAILPF